MRFPGQGAGAEEAIKKDAFCRSKLAESLCGLKVQVTLPCCRTAETDGFSSYECHYIHFSLGVLQETKESVVFYSFFPPPPKGLMLKQYCKKGEKFLNLLEPKLLERTGLLLSGKKKFRIQNLSYYVCLLSCPLYD